MTAQLLEGGSRRLALRAPLGVAAAGLGAVAMLAVVDPNEPGHYPSCPFLSLTGLFCPGCGSLRAVHALAHGDVGSAVGLNVLTVLAVPVLAVIWLRWVRRAWTGSARASAAPAAVVWALLAAVCVFGLLRNLPAGSALAP
jgi:hypothetical protein